MSITVDQPSTQICELAVEWAVTEALMGGTLAMRKAGQALLPKWPKEDAESYSDRLGQAVLFPAYARTVGVMAGKPFAKQVTLAKAPPKVVEWCEDVDRQGTSLHVFAAEMFEEALAHGLAGILVDTPKAASAGPQTMAQQARIGMRPYFVRVMHRQILGWRAHLTAAGLQLTQLRLREDGEEPDGDFGSRAVERVRVLTPGAWAVWRKVDTAWEVEDSGTTGLDVIPFVPLYGRRTGFMTGRAPLIDLAFQNVEHYQSSSDQRNILHVARVPILVAAGVDEAFNLTIGASAATKLPQGATLTYTEHEGDAIEAGRQSLLDLEARMIATGAELLVAKPGQRTAEESANDAEANKSDLQRIAETFEDSLDLALSFMARLGGQPDTATVSLFKDYAARSLSEASAQLVVQLGDSGKLRGATVLREMQRRGVLSPDLVPEDELALAAEEGPPAGDDEDDDSQQDE